MGSEEAQSPRGVDSEVSQGRCVVQGIHWFACFGGDSRIFLLAVVKGLAG